MRWIATNAGVEGSIVVQKVREGKGANFGYNAATDAYEDMVKAGVIDPTKVVRSALQNASSISSLLRTGTARRGLRPSSLVIAQEGRAKTCREKNGGRFPSIQAQAQGEIRIRHDVFDFQPRGRRNLIGPHESRTRDHHFVVDIARDDDPLEELNE